MHDRSQRQKTDVIENDWAQRLFEQTTDYKNDPVTISGDRAIAARRVSVSSKNGSNWANWLFASSTVDFKSCDKLLVTLNRKVISEFEIRSSRFEILIGSHSLADVLLDAPKVSPFHARIVHNNGIYQIEDLRSERGTFLNGVRLAENEVKTLQVGCSIRIMAFQICLATTESQDKRIYSGRPENKSTLVLTHAEKEPQKNHRLSTVSTASNQDQITRPWTTGTIELRVADIIDETHDVKTFRLVGKTPMSFFYLPGQFITLSVTVAGEAVERAFSVSSSPTRPQMLELTVKRVPNGLVSNWLSDRIKIGDKLIVKGPAGRFSCALKPAKKLLLIGAGSGVAPLMSMIRWLYDTDIDIDTKVLLSFRNQSDVIFEKELKRIFSSSNHITIAITLTGNTDEGETWHGLSGRIKNETLKMFCDDLCEREVYLCGPESFMQCVKNMLAALHFPMQRLHCESFSRAYNLTPSCDQLNHCAPAKSAVREIAYTGKVHKIRFVKSDETVETDGSMSVLELAKAAGVAIDYYCQTGTCGECMVKCLSGRTEMSDDCEIDEHERQQGWIFSCRTFPRSDLEINA